MNILIQKLKNYPQQIHDQEMQVINCYNQKQKAKSDLDAYLLGVDDRIAQDQQLKNDTQRKASKHSFLSKSKIYQKLAEKLIASETNYKLAQVDLEKIKNEFSVTKLEAKMAIAIEQSAA